MVDGLVAGDESAVLCTHRPVLPSVFDALGVDDTKLEPGSMLVVHLRQGTVTATELHRPVSQPVLGLVHVMPSRERCRSPIGPIEFTARSPTTPEPSTSTP